MTLQELQTLTLVVSSSGFAAVVVLIFRAGTLVQRLTELERRVESIDLNGCRHRPPAAQCEGD